MDLNDAVSLPSVVLRAAENASMLDHVPKWMLYILALCCLSLAAIVAGLTLGLMSLDMVRILLKNLHELIFLFTLRYMLSFIYLLYNVFPFCLLLSAGWATNTAEQRQ